MSVAAPRPWAAWNRGIGWEVNDATGEPINNGFRETYSQADARLIAAAPELLEALKEMVAWYSKREGEGSDALLPIVEQEGEVQRAIAAIAKAAGQP